MRTWVSLSGWSASGLLRKSTKALGDSSPGSGTLCACNSLIQNVSTSPTRRASATGALPLRGPQMTAGAFFRGGPISVQDIHGEFGIEQPLLNLPNVIV